MDGSSNAVLMGASHMVEHMAEDAGSIRSGQLPLSFLGRGQTAVVLKVRGTGDMHHHLENLGFVEGAQVRVVNESAGNLIVEVKGAQIALDRRAAAKIITR